MHAEEDPPWKYPSHPSNLSICVCVYPCIHLGVYVSVCYISCIFVVFPIYIHYTLQQYLWIYSWSFSVSRPYSDLPCVMFSCWGRSIGSLVFPQGWREACWCLLVGDTSLPPSLDVLHWWWLCVCSYGSCLPTSVKRLQVVGWVESLT